MAQPLLELDRVIFSVASGIFDPDASRSGRWTHVPSAEEQSALLFPAAATPNRNADSESSGDTSSASEARDEDPGEEGEPPSVVADAEEFGLRSKTANPSAEPLPDLPEAGLIRNRVSGVLHGGTELGVRTQCGRATPPDSHHLGSWPTRPYPLCRNCFRA